MDSHALGPPKCELRAAYANLAYMSNELFYSWRAPIADDELVELVVSHGIVNSAGNDDDRLATRLAPAGAVVPERRHLAQLVPRVSKPRTGRPDQARFPELATFNPT